MGEVANVVYSTVLVAVCCYKCGIPFGLPQDFEQSRRRDHETFYCPSGHGNHYPGKTQVERERDAFREEAARTHDSLASARRDADCQRSQRQRLEREVIARKGHHTRLKKRISAGVCPCCKRTVHQLAAHMAEKHPHYAQPETE